MILKNFVDMVSMSWFICVIAPANWSSSRIPVSEKRSEVLLFFCASSTSSESFFTGRARLRLTIRLLKIPTSKVSRIVIDSTLITCPEKENSCPISTVPIRTHCSSKKGAFLLYS